MKDPLVIISPELGISPYSNSGGEVYDRETLCHYQKAGAKVIAILPKDKPYDTDCFPPSQVYRVILKHIVPPYLFNVLLLPALWKSCRQQKSAIIRIHSPYFSGLGILFFKLFHPSVKTVVSYFHVEAYPLFRWIDRLVLARTDHIFTISEGTKDELLKTYSLDPKKITVTYCGIASKFKPEPRRTDIASRYDLEGKRVLLYLGGLKSRKNLPFLLDVMTELKRTDTLLLFAGSGSEREPLEKKAIQLGIINQIRFTGYVEEADKVSLYNAADIFVFPTILEGFGMVAAEAMACGIPVIASNKPPMTEVVADKKTGLLAEVNNTSAWVTAITTLLDNEAQRHAMGIAAQERVRSHFSWDALAQKQLDIIRLIQTKEIS